MVLVPPQQKKTFLASESCWCASRRSERGPIRNGIIYGIAESESPAFRGGGWGEPEPFRRDLQQHDKRALNVSSVATEPLAHPMTGDPW